MADGGAFITSVLMLDVGGPRGLGVCSVGGALDVGARLLV
jgi:hypothetical protein